MVRHRERPVWSAARRPAYNDALRRGARGCAYGWLDIFVRYAGRQSRPAFDLSVPSINYDLSLRTTAGHLDEDLRIFRAVLATVRLSPSH